MVGRPLDLIPSGEGAVCCARALDPAGYRVALLADADRGPHGPNAAGLRANLRRLRALLGRSHRRNRLRAG